MPRDPGLEDVIRTALAGTTGISEKAMFGGLAFLLDGHIVVGVRKNSLMLRVGPAVEPEALTHEGVEPVVMRGRRMKGYVRALPEAIASDELRERLLFAAVDFTKSLPSK